MRSTPPEEVFFVATEKLPHERRYYGPRRPNRIYEKLAQARLFMSCHKDRPTRLFRGTVTWEEIG